MKTFEGFELRTVQMFGSNTYWHGIRGDQATGDYDSEAALCEAIRTKSFRLTTLPKKE